MDERLEFARAYMNGEETMAELCRRFGISRKTGYKWAGRYLLEGPAGLEDRTSRPCSNSRAVAPDIVEYVLQVRRARPRWGPKKIKAKMENGRHERMHRTLKAETASPPQASFKRQQRAFELFRGDYNYERPHEALGQVPPARVYTPSSRPFPRELEDPEYPVDYEHRRVQQNGIIRWRGERVFTSTCLSGELVGLEPVNYGQWKLHFGPVFLGLLDERLRPWRLVRPRGKRGRLKSVT